jgi:hypothetical protein
MNRFVNPLVKWILRSPAHRLLSSHLLLISVTGRRSGRVYEIPVAYHQSGSSTTINVGAPERKQWWRNFRSSCIYASRQPGRRLCCAGSCWTWRPWELGSRARGCPAHESRRSRSGRGAIAMAATSGIGALAGGVV